MEDMTTCLTMDDYKKLKGLVEKCVKELTEKKDLTPAETKAMKDGFEVCVILEAKMEKKKMEDGMEYSERGYSRHNYSGHDAPYRQYHITSYGRPMNMTYGDMRNGYSGDYGVQGWYRSGDGMSNCGPDPYYYGPEYSDRGMGYSRHSIGDRIIAMMEHEMDSTESPYEKEELRKFMKLIRQAAD